MALVVALSCIAGWVIPYSIAKRMPRGWRGLFVSCVAAYAAMAAVLLLVFALAFYGAGQGDFFQRAIGTAFAILLFLPPFSIWRGRKAGKTAQSIVQQ